MNLDLVVYKSDLHSIVFLIPAAQLTLFYALLFSSIYLNSLSFGSKHSLRISLVYMSSTSNGLSGFILLKFCQFFFKRPLFSIRSSSNRSCFKESVCTSLVILLSFYFRINSKCPLSIAKVWAVLETHFILTKLKLDL